MNALELLPKQIAEKSISEKEIVLPNSEALQAIDIFEAKGVFILGWEGWIKTIEGHVGHGNAPQGTLSLENLTIEEAAKFCRETIMLETELWQSSNPATTNQLHFCITVRL